MNSSDSHSHGPHSTARGTSIRASGGRLAPGRLIGDGRYRLLAQLGADERGGAHFWRSRDGQSRRDVALTVFIGDPADHAAAAGAGRSLDRAAHVTGRGHAGLTSVLETRGLGNALSSAEGLLGIVVAQWSIGSDLVDVVADGPLAPTTACRALEPLAEAVEQSHTDGLVLGIDHPSRLRRTPEGAIRLAFPGPLPDARFRDDVRALGALLYLLVTGYWPLPDGPPALPRAPRSNGETPDDPAVLRPEVPAEIAALAVGTVAERSGGVRTSAAFLRALRRVARDLEDRAERTRATPVERRPGYTDTDGSVWTTGKPVSDARQRRKLALGATVLVVAAVAILAWGGLSLINFFTEDDTAGPEFNVAENGAEQSPDNGADDDGTGEQGGTDGGGDGAGAPGAIEATSIEVFDPQGPGDNPTQAPLAIDGDPTTSWSTFEYEQQLPGLKPGVGLALSFAEPIELSRVDLRSDTPGTEIEIRTAEDPAAPLEGTTVVSAAGINADPTEFDLDAPATTEHVVVWITGLAGVQGTFASEINEIAVFGEPAT